MPYKIRCLKSARESNLTKLYKTAIFIFRRDLRLRNNIGLRHAFELAERVFPCFIFDPRQQSSSKEYFTTHGLQFFIESLKDLEQQLNDTGGTRYRIYGLLHKIMAAILWPAREELSSRVLWPVFRFIAKLTGRVMIDGGPICYFYTLASARQSSKHPSAAAVERRRLFPRENKGCPRQKLVYGVARYAQRKSAHAGRARLRGRHSQTHRRMQRL